MNSNDTEIRRYSPELRSRFLHWCEDAAKRDPLPVLIGGLVYAVGVHPQALPYARLESKKPLAIQYPRLLRQSDLADAPWLPGKLEEPEWLAQAARAFLRKHPRREGQLLIPSRGPAEIPVRPVYLAKVLSAATLEQIGVGLSPTGLWATRLADAIDAGEVLIPQAAGYARSYQGQLLQARRKARYAPTRTARQ